MIHPNNPAIDVNELMQRVRAEAERIRTGAPVERDSVEQDRDVRLTAAVDRHRVISSLLDTAQDKNLPRSELPKRIAGLLGVAGPLKRFTLRVFNYFFKTQRELDAAVIHALRELVHMQYVIGDRVIELSDMIRDEEKYRRDVADLHEETRAAIAGMRAQIAAWIAENAGPGASVDELRDRVERIEETVRSFSGIIGPLETRLKHAHQRIDDNEGALRQMTDRVNEAAKTAATANDRTDFAHRRIDDGERALTDTRQSLAHVFAPDSPGPLRELRKELADRVEAVADRAIRAEALMRWDLSDIRRWLGPGAEPRPAIPGEETRAVARPDRSALYVALEDAFRGRRAEVRERVEVYVELVRQAATVDLAHPLLDVGAGRGELLEALGAAGFAARGVDLNPLLVQEALASSLEVVHADALEVLHSAGDGSFGALTALHLIEHLVFEDFVTLCEQAFRTVRSGGLVAFETPNPANLTVGACSFYLDPTHLHPVPAELASFVLTHVGFTDVKIIWLHAPENEQVAENTDVARRFQAMMYGPRDYAVVARRP